MSDAATLPPLPTFLIVGAQKSATRWLRSNLGEHPDVFAAPRELVFFHSGERFDELGVEWYRSQFEGWAGEPIVGEATPAYMMWHHHPEVVAERIHRVVPDVRLIAILRNPIDRALSAMVHHIKMERLPASSRLPDLARNPPTSYELSLVEGGWYARSLAPYRRLFGDQLLVVLHDDVVDDARAVYRRALQHIGADLEFVSPALDRVMFSNQPRATSGDAPASPYALTDADRRALFEYFRDDVRELESMLDRDLSMWDPTLSRFGRLRSRVARRVSRAGRRASPRDRDRTRGS